MSKITIKVCGTAGAGKSTVAEILMTFLDQNNFNVTHIPMEELNWVQREETKESRFSSMREHCEIEIVEESVLRSSINVE